MYDQKIKSAREAIESHNSNVDQKVDWDKFRSELQKLGGTSEEALAVCSFEDLEGCGLPRILAKVVSKVFRGKSEGGSNKSSYVSYKKAEAMTPRELLERYNPQDVKNAVGKRLKEISDGKLCIVFNADGTVNVDESEKMLAALANGYDEIDTVTVSGSVCQVFRVGQRADFYADIDPLENIPLRPDGTSSKTGRSWNKVEHSVRQLIYIANHITMELRVNGVDDSHNVMDQAVKDGAYDYFKTRYRQASLKYDEMVKTGTLPSLKQRLGGGSRAIDQKSNNPFCVSHKTY